MSINLLGTVLASPVVTGNYNTDTYGTHYSFLGVGGWQELQHLSERDAIPVDALGNLDPTGLSSGRRRLGMLVYVNEVDTIFQLFVPYVAWTAMTNTAKVAALANNSNWVLFTAGGGGGDAIKKKYQQTAHGFSVGNVLSFNGTNFVKGIASAGNQYEFLGMVSSIIDADHFILTYAGFIDLTSVPGLSGNSTYFVSPSIAGGITLTEPFNPGESSRPMLITQTPTNGLVLMSRSSIVSNVGSSGNTGNGMRIQRTTLQTAHGFTVGDAIVFTGSTYHKALARGSNPFPIGIVNQVFDPNTFIVCFDGYVDGFAGVLDEGGKHLSGSTLYYVSATSPGKLSRNKPVQNNDYVIPIYQSITTDDGIVKNNNGLLVREEIGQEIFVVPNISARDAKFVASGSTPGIGQVESFPGLTVFVISATTSGVSKTYIDTTGFLAWSAITTTTTVILDWNSITNKPNVVTGATNIGTGTGKLVKIPLSGSTPTIFIKTVKAGTGIGVVNNPNDVTLSVTGSTTGATFIGLPETGSTYINGIFNDFTPSTRTGLTIDRFNKLFLLVLPAQPASLSSIDANSANFVNGNLSWGISRNDIAYVNVGTNAGNPAVDINGTYSISGNRYGITNIPVTGTLNVGVVGNISGIPFFNGAFPNGDQGKLTMFKNGVKVAQLALTGTTAATSNARFSVSAVQFVKTNSGSPVPEFKYRTGTYTMPTSGMSLGYNYVRIVHSGSSFNYQTNFIEFVYDSDATPITAIGTGLTNVSLSGTKNISGVKYFTSGTVQYQGTINNPYKNIYSPLATAISFPNRVNLSNLTTMDVTGAGINNRLGSPLQTLPTLNTAVSNPQNTSISILATLPISTTVLLGNVGSIGKIQSGVAIAHPFATKLINGGVSSKTGFMFYNVTQGSVLNAEDFTGEVLRLQARDYSTLTYGNVNGGVYVWDSTQSLIGVNPQHNTGLLVFNGELIYPNAAYLTTQYGITTGNFAAVTNTPVGNVNYTSASGIRDYYREFKSSNAAVQSTLTFAITHTGIASDFLTNGGTGGVPSGNNIKVEFLIMRSDTTIYGWANPFASSGNPFGIANTSTNQVGNVMTVSCTLSTTPRVGLNDIVVVRIFAASGYTNRIQHISVTNI